MYWSFNWFIGQIFLFLHGNNKNLSTGTCFYMAIIKTYQLVLPLRNFYMTFHVLPILIKILHNFTCAIYSFITCKHRCLLFSSGMLSGDNRFLTKPISSCYGTSWKVTVHRLVLRQRKSVTVTVFRILKVQFTFFECIIFFLFPNCTSKVYQQALWNIVSIVKDKYFLSVVYK